MFERKQYDEFPTIEIKPGEITISGRSIPEDADFSYYPFIRQLEAIAEKKQDLIVNFKYDYYNTASTRYITRIISILNDLSIVAKVVINWYYLAKDEDMEDLGTDYKEMYENLKIKLIKR